jgi:hypothetical protein
MRWGRTRGRALTGSAQTQWKPGQSGNPRGGASIRVRVQARMVELAAEHGGLDALTQFERTLVEQAAKLLERKGPMSAEDHVRISNAVVRFMTKVERSRKKAQPKSQTLAAWAASGASGASGSGRPRAQGLSSSGGRPARLTGMGGC